MSRLNYYPQALGISVRLALTLASTKVVLHLCVHTRDHYLQALTKPISTVWS